MTFWFIGDKILIVKSYGVNCMKKILAIIMACVISVTSLTVVGATPQNADSQYGFAVKFNGQAIECTSVIYNNTHYVPFRKVFEKMGAYVFYRNRDKQILALSRDGDMIYHTVGNNTITVNGKQKTVNNPSIIKNNETYIPIDMVSVSLQPDGIFYDNQQLNIQKYIFTNGYNELVKDVLDVCKNSEFYPERFKRYINYHYKMPSYSMKEIIYRVNLELDYPFYENVTTIEYPHELRVLVNKHHQLPAGFKQYNLVNMAKAHTVNDGKQYLLSAGAYESYVKMSNAAKKEGLSMRVVSAYRTEDFQRNLYNNRLATTGKANADNYTARPGFSEHQTGLAVDISSTKGTFEYTSEFKWLQKHAHEYGYILRYPKGKEWITGYSYEPWHYRYVGTKAAGIIYEKGITYEEYYAKYVLINEFK